MSTQPKSRPGPGAKRPVPNEPNEPNEPEEPEKKIRRLNTKIHNNEEKIATLREDRDVYREHFDNAAGSGDRRRSELAVTVANDEITRLRLQNNETRQVLRKLHNPEGTLQNPAERPTDFNAATRGASNHKEPQNSWRSTDTGTAVPAVLPVPVPLPVLGGLCIGILAIIAVIYGFWSISSQLAPVPVHTSALPVCSAPVHALPVHTSAPVQLQLPQSAGTAYTVYRITDETEGDIPGLLQEVEDLARIMVHEGIDLQLAPPYAFDINVTKYQTVHNKTYKTR